MIITLKDNCSAEDLKDLMDHLTGFGLTPKEVTTQKGAYVVAVGNIGFDIRKVGHHDAVQDVHRVSDAYKLVSKKWKAKPTEVTLSNEASIRAGGLSLIAGPCSLESEEQIDEIAKHLSEQGVKIMRGGAFKPRTSPYSFRGLGIEGLKLFHQIAHSYGISIVSEVVSVSHIEDMYDYVDMYQVGTRNAQNFDLLHELGAVDKPVLLKRGMSGTLDELLQSAEYIFANGNERLVLCERGIRTYEKAYRNTLDLNAVPVLKEKTHLPVIVDPSHGIGVRRWVEPMALAGVMAGADGLIVEIHKEPEKALSDAAQTLDFAESERLISRCREAFELRSRL